MSAPNIEDYSSRWDYMADKVGAPRRPTPGAAPTHFTIAGRFVGDWQAELEHLLAASREGEPYNFLAKKAKDPSAKGAKTKQLNQADMDRMGLSPSYEFVRKIRNVEAHRALAPTICKMIDWFAFSGQVVANIHVQNPGHVFPFHFDNLITVRGNSAEITDDPAKHGRVEIMLRDWEFGHMWGVGNAYWSNWRAGEIMFHPWHDTPHGTANAGMAPRVNLQVTGEMTPELAQRLTRDNGDISLA